MGVTLSVDACWPVLIVKSKIKLRPLICLITDHIRVEIKNSSISTKSHQLILERFVRLTSSDKSADNENIQVCLNLIWQQMHVRSRGIISYSRSEFRHCAGK